MESIVEDRHRKASAPHVLVISHGAAGHLTPLLRMATQLARRGITITFVSSEVSISRLASAKRDGDGEFQGLDFRFVPARVPEGLFASPSVMSRGYREALKPELERLVHEKSTGSAGGPTSIISDIFFSWTQDFADKLQIPRYTLIPSGAIYARAMQGFVHYYESGQCQISTADGKQKLVPFDWPVRLTGIPSLSYHEMPQSARDFAEDFRRRCESIERSAGVIVNSFVELEEKAIKT